MTEEEKAVLLAPYSSTTIKIPNIVRTITPQLIAQQLTGVQPLANNSGLLFALKQRYGLKRTSLEAQDIQERWDARVQKRTLRDAVTNGNNENKKRKI